MKKIIAVLMAACMVCSMAACGSEKTNSSSSDTETAVSQDDTGTSQKTDESTAKSAKSAKSGDSASSSDSDSKSESSPYDFDVEKKDGMVYVTMPASNFTNKTVDEIKADAKEMGYSDAAVNDDGSVTYKMTEDVHNEKLDNMKEQVDIATESALEGENAVESFIAVDYNDDYSLFTITVDKSKYSEEDALSNIWLYYVLGSTYRAYFGISKNADEVVVKVIDKSGEVISTKNYSQFMEEHNLE